MNATYLPIIPPTQESTGLTPEQLAATLARYSRSNEGIQPLIEDSRGKSPDAIFKFVDYGHASIAGLTGGVAITLDDISMILAARIFEFAQMADGQESSTRYIALSSNPEDSLVSPESLGVPPHLVSLWKQVSHAALELYQSAMETLESDVSINPSLARIPDSALAKPKVAQRMLKNYALDRARYLLPASSKTNIAVVASARTWADIIKLVDSLPWRESKEAAGKLRSELAKASPNLPRHSYADQAAVASLLSVLQDSQLQTAAAGDKKLTQDTPCVCRVDTFNPSPTLQFPHPSTSTQFLGKTNRYSHPGPGIKRISVQTEWNAITFAEFRDLNRHRTGHRWSNYSPQGLHLPKETIEALLRKGKGDKLQELIKNYAALLTLLAREATLGLHTYAFLLGTQIPFEHTQQADKFLYEVELRTGLGAHYKYAEHLKQAAEGYFQLHPEHKEFVTLGEAEPE